VQLVADPLQAVQFLAHGRHLFVPSLYCPSGQAFNLTHSFDVELKKVLFWQRQVLFTNYMVVLHELHLFAAEDVHVKQPYEHAIITFLPLLKYPAGAAYI
jgi:hypothetical protein